ncbi:MAG TPA: TonB family protein [Pyrinomonadaceae bacterium]
MFERLVITNSTPMQTDRTWFFLSSALIVCAALVAGLVISLFSKELSLGNDNFELVELVAPVEPVVEAEPPPPEEPPQTPVIEEQTVASAPTRRIERARTTRRVNMARTDETPPAVPKGVSTTPNTYKARPANRYFGLGKADIDHAGYAPARLTSGGSSSGSGSSSLSGLGQSVAAIKKTVPRPPPPPPRKKTPLVKKSVTRSLGVINGKARSLPKPRYPLTARAVRAEGKVSVKVLINERGRVVSANAVSGHPLLRNAAEAAARQAEFSPTLLSGKAVKVSGVIVYNFSV